MHHFTEFYQQAHKVGIINLINLYIRNIQISWVTTKLISQLTKSETWSSKPDQFIQWHLPVHYVELDFQWKSN